MADPLKPKVVSLSLAATSGILYLACALLFAVAPQAMLNLANSLFHGLDITQIAKASMTFGGVLAGLIQALVYAWIAGWLFAIVYNTLLKKAK